MTLQRLHIDGYLQFHDFRMDFGPGVNVLHGPNEAGKSTLLRFIRYVLFGPPHWVSERGTPLAGGRFGGTLWFSPNEVALERFDRTARLVRAGVPHPETEIGDVLGQFDRASFDAVFAADLDGLRTLGALDDEALRRSLFASSVLGATADIDAIEKRWSERIKELGKRSRNGVIRGLELEVDAARGRLQAARAQALALPRLLGDIAELDRSVAEGERLVLVHRREHEHLDAVLEVQEKLSERTGLRSWLVEHERPTQPTAVWEHRVGEIQRATQDVRQAGQEVSKLGTRHEQAVRQLDQVRVDARLLGAAPRLPTCRQEATDLPSLPELEHRVREAARDEDHQLEDLGLANLDSVDLSASTTQEIRKAASNVPMAPDLGTARRALTAAEDAVSTAEKHTAKCPAAGPALALQHQLPVLDRAEERVGQLCAQRAQLNLTRLALTAEQDSHTERWPCLPCGDRSHLLSVVALVAEGRQSRDARRAELGVQTRAAEELRAEVEGAPACVEVSALPATVVEWARRHQVIREMVARREEQAAQVGSLTEDLERQVSALPAIRDLDALTSCVAVPWAEVQAECRRAMAPARVLMPFDDVPDRAMVLDEHSRGRRLHEQRESVQPWRFATRTLLVVLGMLMLIALAALLASGNGWATGVLVVAAAVFLLAVAIEIYLARRMASVTAALVALDAADSDAWTRRIHADLARIDLAELHQHEHGALDAQDAERTRATERLTELVAPVLGGTAIDPVVLADLATQLPTLLDTLRRCDALRAESLGTEQVLAAWTAEGKVAAEAMGVPTPTTPATAIALADQVAETVEAGRREAATREARLRELEAKCDELARKTRRVADLSEPTAPETRAREAVHAAGGVQLDEDAWSPWLDAGLRHQELAAQEEELAQRIEAIEAELAKEQRTLEDALTLAGVGTLAALRDAVALAVDQEQARSDAVAKLDAALAERTRMAEELAVREEQHRLHVQARSRLDELLADAGWPPVREAGVEALSVQLKAARRAERVHAEATRDLQAARERWKRWLSDAKELAAALGVDAPTHTTSTTWLQRRQEELEQARMADARRQAFEAQVEQVGRELEEAKVIAAAAEDRLATVQKEAGVETTEAAVAQCERARTWERKQNALEQLESLLRAHLGDVDLDELASTDRLALEARLAAVAAALAVHEASRDELLDRRARQKQTLEQLERSADVVEAEDEVNTLEEQLHRARMELAEITLAMRWLKDEYERYVRENQPAVLKVASRLLARASNGTMVAVMQEKDRLYVVAPDGKPREPAALSRGTCEMLYLVIRMALALQHADRMQVPILLDDVMVNQDPERAEQIARVIAEVGQQHQVVLMTCRPEMRDLMCAVDPTTRVVELERFGGREAPVGTTAVSKVTEAGAAPDVVERVVTYLAATGGWRKRRAIMAGAELSDAEWARFRADAEHDPRVEHNGKAKRGSAYRLAA